MKSLELFGRQVCQRQNILAAHTPLELLRWRLDRGLGIKSGVRRALGRGPAPRTGSVLGRPSRFQPGSWVRVLDREGIHATLDEHAKLRGLLWVPAQWDYAGGVFRVARQVRRIQDDRGEMRAVSGTVLLEGVTCAGRDGTAGCGRHCPLMFRDEWLEPTGAPGDEIGAAESVMARVRSVDEIRATLDGHGRRDGLMFVPEMASYAGRRFRVTRQLGPVFENDEWRPTRAAIYLLDGLHCSGAILGDAGPCHRACALLWHEDWLELEA